MLLVLGGGEQKQKRRNIRDENFAQPPHQSAHVGIWREKGDLAPIPEEQTQFSSGFYVALGRRVAALGGAHDEPGPLVKEAHDELAE